MPRKINCGLLFALLLALALPQWLQAIPQAPPFESRVRELDLDNGLKVVVVERHEAPVFFTLTSFRVGSCQELPNRSGLAHFLEHMMFKGSQSIGTTDYKAESKIMDELETAATEMRQLQVDLQSWRFDMFEDYSQKIRAEIPEEKQAKGETDEAATWKSLLDKLPTDTTQLPEEWRKTPWVISDGSKNYWAMYRDYISTRERMGELLNQQRKFVTSGEPLSGIYEPRGGEMLNAFTAEDQTTYMLGLPSNCLELFMFVESDRFQHPVFREFYPEKEVVMEELRNHENEPESILYQTFLETAFDAHPYGRPVIGWMSDIKLTLRSDMEAYFWRYYTPNNCQMTIVGDVNTDEVFALAKRYFSAWKKGQPSPEVTIKEPEQRGEKRVVVEQDTEPQMLIGYHIPAAPDPDYYALQMAMQVLSGGKTSRFYRNIYVAKGLTASSPNADDAPANRYPNLFVISATPKAPHTTLEVEGAIYEELEKLKTEPVTDWELERVRNGFRKNQLQKLASNRWLAFDLSGNFVRYGDWHATVTDFDRLMTVKSEDIQRVASKYLTPENRTVATLVKKEAAQASAPAKEEGLR